MLRVGDSLALYTDGLAEAHAPARMLTSEELQAALAEPLSRVGRGGDRGAARARRPQPGRARRHRDPRGAHRRRAGARRARGLTCSTAPPPHPHQRRGEARSGGDGCGRAQHRRCGALGGEDLRKHRLREHAFLPAAPGASGAAFAFRRRGRARRGRDSAAGRRSSAPAASPARRSRRPRRWRRRPLAHGRPRRIRSRRGSPPPASISSRYSRRPSRWASTSRWTPKCVIASACRLPAGEHVDRLAPCAQVDVRRRRRRERRPGADPHPRDVAGESPAAGFVQVSDVVRGVPGHVGDAQPLGQPLAALQRADALGRHRQHLAPQPLHLRAVEPPGAREQPARVGDVRRAALVHPHLEVGEAGGQRACRARVVEVDVRERQRARRTALEVVEQRRQAGGGAWVDDHVADAPGGDRVRAPEVHEVGELRFLRRHTGADCSGPPPPGVRPGRAPPAPCALRARAGSRGRSILARGARWRVVPHAATPGAGARRGRAARRAPSALTRSRARRLCAARGVGPPGRPCPARRAGASPRRCPVPPRSRGVAGRVTSASAPVTATGGRAPARSEAPAARAAPRDRRAAICPYCLGMWIAAFFTAGPRRAAPDALAGHRLTALFGSTCCRSLTARRAVALRLYAPGHVLETQSGGAMKAVTWQGKRDVRVENVPDPRDRGADRRDRPGHLHRALRLRPAPVRGARPVHRRGRHPRPRADGDRRGGRRRRSTDLTAGDRVVVPFNIACGHCLMCGQRAAVAVRDDPGARAGHGRGAVRLHQALRPGARRAGRVPARAAGPVRPDQGARTGRPTTASSTSPTCCRRRGRRSSTPSVPDGRHASSCSGSGRSATWLPDRRCTAARSAVIGVDLVPERLAAGPRARRRACSTSTSTTTTSATRPRAHRRAAGRTR